MEDVLLYLHHVNIITEKNVEDLRNYIYHKNPNYTTKKNSQILANALNQIIEKNMPNVNNNFKKDIKRELFRNATNKASFKIDADEILLSCLNVEQADAHYFNQLFLWIDEKVDMELEKESTIMKLQNFFTESANSVLLEDFKSIKIHTPELHDLTTQELELNVSFEPNYMTASDSSISLQTQTQNYNSSIINWKKFLLAATLIPFLLITYTIIKNIKTSVPVKEVVVKKVVNKVAVAPNQQNTKMYSNNLEVIYQFHEINKNKLREYLLNKNSLLAEEPYFSTINNTSEKYNINPLLLFAITAIEQSLVPKNSRSAKLIANNPFNVYHSWQDYNTNIYDSSNIAARTIVNASKGRPQSEDSIRWINRVYCETPNWWVSVKQYFRIMNDSL
jgi:putative ABC transport system permease protein